MLARNEVPVHTGPILSKKKPKRPTQFMFIDSSNGGINAKRPIVCHEIGAQQEVVEYSTEDWKD
jgi:hypothetical protein